MYKLELCAKCGFIKQQCECKEPKTNAERCREMNNAELAAYLEVRGFCIYSSQEDAVCIHVGDDIECEQCIKEWLQSEVEE